MSLPEQSGPSHIGSARLRRRAYQKWAKETLKKAPVDLTADRLTNKIKKVAKAIRESSQNRDEFYLRVAEFVVAECIRIAPNNPAFGDFFEHPSGEPEHAWRYSARIMSVAEPLYKLRDIDGFGVICRRMTVQRSLKDAACELYAASMFFDAGFKLQVKAQSDKKGSDFDFRATKNGTPVNVEVSSIECEAYSSERVFKKLRAKKSQLPANEANALFIFVPEQWFDGSDDVNMALQLDAGAFMIGETERINAVIFMNETHQTFGVTPLSAGMLGFEFSAVRVTGARAEAEELHAFVDRSLDRPNPNIVSVEDALERMPYRRDTELIRWADEFWERTQ